MGSKKYLCVWILLIIGMAETKASLYEMEIIFKETFDTGYEPRKCGQNILGLLKRARERGVDLRDANIIELENLGGSVFGLLNVELARESGRFNPQYPESGRRNFPGERNWYFHVIFEYQGQIFDFDFTNDPEVLSSFEYFEQMFLIEKTTAEGGDFYVGRKNKLESYQLKITKALDVLKSQTTHAPAPRPEIMRLGEYLNLDPK